MQTSADDALTDRLEEVLLAIPNRALAQRLRCVYVAACRAVNRLGELDLIRYEPSTMEGPPDLALWEEMAPIIRDTVLDVNALVQVVEEQFPSSGATTDRRFEEARRALADASAELSQEVSHLGVRMRSPQVVADRWNLLSELQSFRQSFRERIAQMVYNTAAAFDEVSPSDVMTFYQDEIRGAVVLRAAVADLGRILSVRLQRFREAEPEDVQWSARQLERDLDAFGRTSAYRVLTPTDKRALLEFRQSVGGLAEQPMPSLRELMSATESFVAVVRALGQLNARAILDEHDRERTAAAGVALERASQFAEFDEEAAAAAASEAFAHAGSLYGKDPDFDALLRRTRKVSVAEARGDELTALISELAESLARIQVF